MPRPLSELQGWLDYDRDDLPHLSPEERIEISRSNVTWCFSSRSIICSTRRMSSSGAQIHPRS